MLHLLSSITFYIAVSCGQAERQHLQIKTHTRALFQVTSLRGGDNEDQVSTQAGNSPYTKSPYEYIPVTALDDYGQSTQLRHAMESALRYGTPVVACLCRADQGDTTGESGENAILVCSLQRPRLGVIGSTCESNSLVRNLSKRSVHSSIQGMVKVLATRDDSTTHIKGDGLTSIPKHSLHTALISTGIQSDSSFLLSKLQFHLTSKYWARYDTLPHGEVLVRMIREILLDFLGYDWDEEVGSASLSGGIGSAAPSSSSVNEESTRAGRPLGVSTILIELDQLGVDDSPLLTVIKANGSSENYVAHAMGIGSKLGNKRLSQVWKKDMPIGEAKCAIREILKEIALDVGWLAENDETKDEAYTNDDSELPDLDSGSKLDMTVVCEIVTRNGIGIEYFNLR